MERNKLLVYFLVFLAGIALSFLAIGLKFNLTYIGILIFFLVFIPTLINPDIGLVIIIISMLLSPDITLGMTTRREISIRIEDIFLLVIIFAWFIRTAFTKNILKTFKSRLTVPFFLYIGSCVVSTILAAVFSEIDIAHSFLSILKYLQYFLLFLMVKDNIRSMRQVKIFMAVFLFVALIVAVHSNIAIYEGYSMGRSFFRIAPPVDTRGGGEAGTLGGYLIFMMAIVGGLIIYEKRSPPLKISLIILGLLLFRAFLYTLSRGSYLAFLPMLIALFFFSRKITFIYFSLFFIMFSALFMPVMVRQRIVDTVIINEKPEGMYLQWDGSAQERIDTWQKIILEHFPNSPLFGYGVAKRFIDSQIFLTLYEVGLLGLFLFIWVLIRVFKMAKKVFYNDVIQNNDFSKGIALGFLAGYIGLIFNSISTNVFIIIRIMEPFWFMAAIVLSLPELTESGEITMQPVEN